MQGKAWPGSAHSASVVRSAEACSLGLAMLTGKSGRAESLGGPEHSSYTVTAPKESLSRSPAFRRRWLFQACHYAWSL